MSRSSLSLVVFGCLLVASSAFAQSATFNAGFPQWLPTGQLYAEVTFADGKGAKLGQQQFYASSAADLEQQVQKMLVQLLGAQSDANGLGTGGPVPVPVPSVTPPPPVMTPEQQFFSDLDQWLVVTKDLAAAGIDTSLSADYAALQKRVQTEFQSSYINDAGWPRP